MKVTLCLFLRERRNDTHYMPLTSHCSQISQLESPVAHVLLVIHGVGFLGNLGLLGTSDGLRYLKCNRAAGWNHRLDLHRELQIGSIVLCSLKCVKVLFSGVRMVGN